MVVNSVERRARYSRTDATFVQRRLCERDGRRGGSGFSVYAMQIARDWNAKDPSTGYRGYVTRFQFVGLIEVIHELRRQPDRYDPQPRALRPSKTSGA